MEIVYRHAKLKKFTIDRIFHSSWAVVASSQLSSAMKQGLFKRSTHSKATQSILHMYLLY